MSKRTQRPAEQFWRALLLARSQARWGNFSWMSPKTLLASVNDRISGVLDNEIVPTRRMRWVAAQRARSCRSQDPIKWPAATNGSFLVLGDPGEMDASQYALVLPVLRMQDQVDFMVLCSDIVYPAGDINQWADAVYLPYFGLPKDKWTEATDALTAGDLQPWTKPVYALPGNHDWYDGLSGFMFHVCGAEGLPPVSFSSAGLSFRERLARRMWQLSSRPKRRLLMEMRALVERNLDLSEAELGPVHAMPRQPGPYCAIDFCGIRLILIDTGVDGRIDVEQKMWLAKMLEDACPKIVLSGKPLLVENQLHELPLQESQASPGAPETLWELLHGKNVVAVVAGDIHNYQRFVLDGAGTIERAAPDDITVTVPVAQPMPKIHLVNGGGGAYLKTTHAIALRDGVPELRSSRQTTVPKVEAFLSYPKPADALGLFVARSRFAGFIVLGLLALTIVGCTLAEVALWQSFLGARGDRAEFVLLPFVTLGLVVVGLKFPGRKQAMADLGKQHPGEGGWSRSWRWTGLHCARWLPAILGTGVLLYALWHSGLVVTGDEGDHTLGDPDGKTLLLAWAGVVLVPLAVFGPPIMRIFPPKTKAVRSIAAALGISSVGVVASLRNRTWFEVIAAGLVTMVVLLALYTALRAWLADIEHRRVEGRLNTTRGILVAVFWFLVGIAPLAAVCCLPFLVFDGSARYVLLLVANTELCLVLAVTFFALFRGPGHAGFRRLPYSWRGLLGLFAAMPVAFVVTPLRSAEPLGLALDSAYGVAVLLALTASLPLAALAAAMLWAAMKAAPSADDSPPKELTRVLTEEVAAKHGTPATTRSVQAAHVAAIASIPGISEIAEAVKPPFYKSFLKVSIANEARTITFDAFGVRGDEDLQKSPDGANRIDHLVLKLEDPVGLEDGAALPEVVVDSIEPVMFGIGDFPGS